MLWEIASGLRAWQGDDPRIKVLNEIRPRRSAVRDTRWLPLIESMWQQEPRERKNFAHCIGELLKLRDMLLAEVG